MSPTLDAFLRSWPSDPWLVASLLLSARVYFRGWRILHRRDPQRWHAGRLASFLRRAVGDLSRARLADRAVRLAAAAGPHGAAPAADDGRPAADLAGRRRCSRWCAGCPRRSARCGSRRCCARVDCDASSRGSRIRSSRGRFTSASLGSGTRRGSTNSPSAASAGTSSSIPAFIAAALLFWYPVVRPYPSRPHLVAVAVVSLPAARRRAEHGARRVAHLLVARDLSPLREWPAHRRALGARRSGRGRRAHVGAGVDRVFGAAVCGGLSLACAARASSIGPHSPNGARVNSQGRQPLEPARHKSLSPGRGDSSSATSTNTVAPAGAFDSSATLNQGLTPLAMDCRPFGAKSTSRIVNSRRRALPILNQSPLTIGQPLRPPAHHCSAPPPLASLPPAAANHRRLLAVAVIVDGLLGPQLSPLNLAGVLPWIHWRGLLILGLLVAGNLFCMACPFTLPRALARRLLHANAAPGRGGCGTNGSPSRSSRSSSGATKRSPSGTAPGSPPGSRWLLRRPRWPSTAFFQGASFCKYVCPIGQFNFVQSLVSPLEVAVREPSVCTTCTTKECIRGSATLPGCEMGLYQPRKLGNFDCTFCLDCVHACPHENVGVLAVVPGAHALERPFPLRHRPLQRGVRDVAALVLRAGLRRLRQRRRHDGAGAELARPTASDGRHRVAAGDDDALLRDGDRRAAARRRRQSPRCSADVGADSRESTPQLADSLSRSPSFRSASRCGSPTTRSTSSPVGKRSSPPRSGSPSDLGVELLGPPAWICACCRPAADWVLRVRDCSPSASACWRRSTRLLRIAESQAASARQAIGAHRPVEPARPRALRRRRLDSAAADGDARHAAGRRRRRRRAAGGAAMTRCVAARLDAPVLACLFAIATPSAASPADGGRSCMSRTPASSSFDLRRPRPAARGAGRRQRARAREASGR